MEGESEGGEEGEGWIVIYGLTLGQVSAKYGQLDKSGPPHVFVNKIC